MLNNNYTVFKVIVNAVLELSSRLLLWTEAGSHVKFCFLLFIYLLFFIVFLLDHAYVMISELLTGELEDLLTVIFFLYNLFSIFILICPLSP